MKEYSKLSEGFYYLSKGMKLVNAPAGIGFFKPLQYLDKFNISNETRVTPRLIKLERFFERNMIGNRFERYTDTVAFLLKY